MDISLYRVLYARFASVYTHAYRRARILLTGRSISRISGNGIIDVSCKGYSDNQASLMRNVPVTISGNAVSSFLFSFFFLLSNIRALLARITALDRSTVPRTGYRKGEKLVIGLTDHCQPYLNHRSWVPRRSRMGIADRCFAQSMMNLSILRCDSVILLLGF